MMTKEQYLLIKLAEECSELSQIALKTAQFGVHQKYDKADKDNLGRVIEEYNDVIGCIELLNEENVAVEVDFDQIDAKKKKVRKYMALSQELGMVEK